MTQGVPSGLEGQIDSPSSLEMLWDKYKRLVLGGAIAVVAAIGVSYALEYMERRANDAKWSAIAERAGFASVYTDLPPGSDQQNFDNFLAQQRRSDVIAGLAKDVGAVPQSEVDALVAEAKGDSDLEPVSLWVKGMHSFANEDFAGARAAFTDLQSRFKDHFLVRETEHPVQVQDDVEVDEDEEDPKSRRRKPELEEPVAGSAVGMMLERVSAQEEFRTSQSRLYEPKVPTSDQVAVIEFEDPDGTFSGTVKIKFFTEHAPKHVAAFLKAVEDKFWDGIKVHRVERKGTQPFLALRDPMTLPSEMHFGLPMTRDALRADWSTTEEVDESHVVEWEGSSALSHFPGSVAAIATPGGEDSQIERIAINAKDVAASKDGSRVIFGRVIEGLDLIERIVADVEFLAETDNQNGAGVPADDIVIKSITIE